MSELKCCKRCGAFLTCDHKGECCVECEYFDPIDMICIAGPEKKAKPTKEETSKEVDPDTFLFEDDEEDEDLSDLPPERGKEEEEEEEEDFDDDDDEDFDEDFDLDDDDW